jgi:prepilin-type N-terminal cleavage/methylation domain-containing protein
MPRAWSSTNTKNQRGFSLVELLLAAVVFGFLVTGLIGAIVYGRASSANAGDRGRATLLAEEGIEATRNIAAAAYANLVNGTYGLTQASNQWVLSGTSDVSGIYTRQIVVAAAGTNRESITSTVTWPQAGGTTGSVALTTRLTNWPAAIKSWSNAIVAGAQDVTGTNNAVKTDTVGNFAYTVLSATTNNFVITNISNAAAPVNVSTTTLAGTPTNIFVSGNYAYITNTSDTAELQVVDISVPATPVLKASVNMTGTGDGLGVYVSGTFAYVVRAADATASANELTIVNITNPLVPVVSGGYNNDIAMNEVYVSGTFAYIATSSTTQEMLVVNVTTPATPTLTATYNPATALAALTITGFGNTVLLGMSTTLDAINVTTPAAPARLGTFTAVGTINDVDVDITNKFAFLGTVSTTGEFQVVNITAPAAITLAKTVDVTGTTSTVSGVRYNSSLDTVVGATASDTQEVIVFTRN